MVICSIGDSLDLVPIAAFHGRGKRAGLLTEITLSEEQMFPCMQLILPTCSVLVNQVQP